jgi:hypothetical protein
LGGFAWVAAWGHSHGPISEKHTWYPQQEGRHAMFAHQILHSLSTEEIKAVPFVGRILRLNAESAFLHALGHVVENLSAPWHTITTMGQLPFNVGPP